MNNNTDISLKTKIETQLLPNVLKPMRYSGGELNSIYKDLSAVSVHGVLCFPDLYDIGMSHTGLQILYHIINSHDEWALSRCFHPWADAEKIMRSIDIPLYALEYFTPLQTADWIGFSVQYELQYTNIVNMLELGGIEPLREKRDDSFPLVVAGGPCVGNPEPLTPFIDAFAIGDGEDTIVAVSEKVEKAKELKRSRKQLLEELAGIGGVYVPAHYQIRKSGAFFVPESADGRIVYAAKRPLLEDRHYPNAPIVPLMEVVHRRMAVEVMRGCTRGCRFCSAGMYYRPVRERPPLSIREQISRNTEHTGCREIGLLSLSTADYSSLSELLQLVSHVQRKDYLSCSLPSTRLDALSPEQLDLLEKVSPVTSITIAPEAGSERLRRVINKDFSDETIISAVRELMRRNVQTLKLYFMLGLPTEDDEDMEAIISLVIRIAGMVRAVSRRRNVNVSLSPFSPKPHTPFQCEQMDSPQNIIEKSKRIKSALRHLKNVKVVYRDPDQTMLETVLARGDRSVGELVYHVWKKGGRFDGWDECFSLQRWIESASELNIPLDTFTGRIYKDQLLPWTVVSTGISQDFLEREREKAYSATATEDCRNGTCCHCGVCNSETRPVYSNAGSERSLFSVIMSDREKQTSDESQSITGNVLYRVTYEKTGIMRFLGHLDMVTVFHRACRMAGLPLVYSRGYHPHARLSFGPPLPFGVSGLNEAFDVTLSQSDDYDFRTINRWLPGGLTVKDADPIPPKTPSLNSAIHAARYLFTPRGSVSFSQLKERIESIQSFPELPVVIEKKGRRRIKDIRKGMYAFSLSDAPPSFSAVLSLKAPDSCKPVELLFHVLPDCSFFDVDIVREACYL